MLPLYEDINFHEMKNGRKEYRRCSKATFMQKSFYHIDFNENSYDFKYNPLSYRRLRNLFYKFHVYRPTYVFMDNFYPCFFLFISNCKFP